jgi:hypothetical protein
MVVTAAHISPLIALIAGILILIVPQLLNYVISRSILSSWGSSG